MRSADFLLTKGSDGDHEQPWDIELSVPDLVNS